MYLFTLRFASIFLLGVAISSSRASAWYPSPQDAPPKKEQTDKPKTVAPPKQDPKSADKPKTLEKAKAGEKLQPKVESKGKADLKSKVGAVRPAAAKRKSKGKPKFEMNPDAKWACDKPAATLEPVWRGKKSLTFQFSIRNEGTANLRINAKGG